MNFIVPGDPVLGRGGYNSSAVATAALVASKSSFLRATVSGVVGMILRNQTWVFWSSAMAVASPLSFAWVREADFPGASWRARTRMFAAGYEWRRSLHRKRVSSF